MRHRLTAPLLGSGRALHAGTCLSLRRSWRQEFVERNAVGPEAPTTSYFDFLRSRMIASSASITSSRLARLFAKLILRLKAFVGGRYANT